ncbi:Lipase maturation factor 2 [Hypsibius exemplaris]|uniref:Lipase maturation factor n=1 Tax=Hypsibius exemplaris TaxID=2072580 RepID=A0A1W0WVM7_HYPEX|nr:Lipase maturation factor 2 [Hypsibius exemplaris]
MALSDGQVHVHNLFLWSMAVIYLFAFASLYHQLPGLYGDNGILPVAKDIVKSPPLEFSRLVHYVQHVKPTLLWVTQALKIDVQTGMDILALTGIALASCAIITRFARNIFVFGALWTLYLSLHSVGNVFLWFQWDALLLEAGFLTFIFAPIPLIMPARLHAQLASISMWPVKWLLFRLMFMTAIVKLQSGCQTWWKLTALQHLYETQGLPHFLGWYWHQMPNWFHSLTLLYALFTDLVTPWFFFAPTRGLRKFAFYNQVFLHVCYMLIGNYNFYNLLAIVLTLGLLDDRDLGYQTHSRTNSVLKSLIAKLFNVVVIGGLTGTTVWLFGVQYDEKAVFKFKAGFTEADLNFVMGYAWPASVALAFTTLAWLLIKHMFRSDGHGGAFAKIMRGLLLGFYMFIALGLFGLSLSPYSTLSKSAKLGTSSSKALTEIREAHRAVEKYSIVNGYGLFRRMPVEGRPELVLEGSDQPDSGWKEYEFLYKPGSLDRVPPFVIPHQPRLDWQMWFAAQVDQRSSPWINNFIYRLLEGQPDVIKLIDPTSPFVKKPPKYIRVRLYKYWFTKHNSKSSSTNWWRRTLDREWMSPVSLTDENFLTVIRSQGLGGVPKTDKSHFKELRVWLKWIRQQAESLSAPIFIWSLFMVNVVFHRTLKALHF